MRVTQQNIDTQRTSAAESSTRHNATWISRTVSLALWALLTMAGIANAQAFGSYGVTNIISDGSVPAAVVDKTFVDPWGISGPRDFWINTAGTGFSYVSFTNGAALFKTTVPSPSGTGFGQPTGTVFNGTTGFLLPNGSPASFMFASLDGTLSGWNGKLGTAGSVAVITVNNSAAKAVYTAMALDTIPSGPTYLLAANFGAGAQVEVYDSTFKKVALTSNFTDPNLPSGYAPYAIHVINSQVYVTYTLRDPAKGYSEILGPNTGFVDVFDQTGTFLKRAITGGNLNAPWGMALAPAGFGMFGGDLLVGNLGDGLINAYDPVSFAYLGQIVDGSGSPILAQFNPSNGPSYTGLWEIVFGNGVATGTPTIAQAGDPNSLYFTAGLAAETHGLFGVITPSATATGPPAFGFSTSSPLASVVSGKSDSLVLSVVPTNGFSGTVTLTCSGLPSGAKCLFGANPLSATGNTSATTTLSMGVNSNYAATAGIPVRGSRGAVLTLALTAPMLLLASAKRRRLLRGHGGVLCMCILFALSLATVAGCSYAPGPVQTPAGTTLVTVTATAGTISKSTTVSMTVK